MGAAWNKPEQPGSSLGQAGSVWDQPVDKPGTYLGAAWNKPEQPGISPGQAGAVWD
jgi:hypothetical protein